jgi:hypothetical protein
MLAKLAVTSKLSMRAMLSGWLCRLLCLGVYVVYGGRVAIFDILAMLNPLASCL